MPKFKNGDVVVRDNDATRRMVVIDADYPTGPQVRCIPMLGSGLEPRVYGYYDWTLERAERVVGYDNLPAGSKVRDNDGSTWTKQPQGWTIVGSWHWTLAEVASHYGPLTLVPAEEPVPVTPKVGDRVLIKGVPGAFSHLNGSRGVVTTLVSRPKYSHEVELDGRPGRLLFAASELELIQEEEEVPAFKVGDRVLIKGVTWWPYSSMNGRRGTVVGKAPDEKYVHEVQVEGLDHPLGFATSELELIQEEAPAFKVGDRVLIKGVKTALRILNSTRGTVAVADASGHYPIGVKLDARWDVVRFKNSELELIQEEEVPTVEPKVTFKVGDKVKVVRPVAIGAIHNGQVGEIVSEYPGGAFPFKVSFNAETRSMYFSAEELDLVSTEPTDDVVTLDPSDPFDAALVDIVLTNRRKRHDYVAAGASPWENFDRVEEQAGGAFGSSVETLIAVKQARLRALETRDAPQNESKADTFKDRAVYATIAYARSLYPTGKVES